MEWMLPVHILENRLKFKVKVTVNIDCQCQKLFGSFSLAHPSYSYCL